MEDLGWAVTRRLHGYPSCNLGFGRYYWDSKTRLYRIGVRRLQRYEQDRCATDGRSERVALERRFFTRLEPTCLRTRATYSAGSGAASPSKNRGRTRAALAPGRRAAGRAAPPPNPSRPSPRSCARPSRPYAATPRGALDAATARNGRRDTAGDTLAPSIARGA